MWGWRRKRKKEKKTKAVHKRKGVVGWERGEEKGEIDQGRVKARQEGQKSNVKDKGRVDEETSYNTTISCHK